MSVVFCGAKNIFILLRDVGDDVPYGLQTAVKTA